MVAVGVLLPSAAIAGVTSSAAPSSPPTGLGVKLLEGPSDRLDDPRAHSYIVDHLAPGTTITRKIGVSSGDTRPRNVSFYAAAASINGGGFVVADGHTANDLTSWTTFSVDQATIQPGETLPVTVTIAVPSGATKGERYGAALAELAGARTGNITTVSRVGIRIYLSIGAGGSP